MKLPAINSAPLERRPGEPSAALRRATEIWPEENRGSQFATILTTACCTPPRFVVLATDHDPLATELPAGSLLAECLPGRSAIVMSPQVDSSLPGAVQSAIAGELLRTLDQTLRELGVLLAQALTPNRQDLASAWFRAAGYREAGDLLYLSADLQQIGLQPPRPPLLGTLKLIPHPPSAFERWIPLIEQTYLNSLDCPVVDGLRPTRDVLIGYQDIGVPRDEWSFIVQHEGRDVGCLILADHRPSNHAELIYMGLVPDVRGRGWGVFLAQEAQRIAAASGAQHLVLSVDAENRPALRHYQAAGFRFWEQRSVWIKAIPS